MAAESTGIRSRSQRFLLECVMLTVGSQLLSTFGLIAGLLTGLALLPEIAPRAVAISTTREPQIP